MNDQIDGPTLIGINDVARLLDCSTRHVRRLHDARAMPSALRLGGCVRWNRDELLCWIASGCLDPHRVTRRAAK